MQSQIHTAMVSKFAAHCYGPIFAKVNENAKRIITSIRKRQMEFFGQVMRREGLEHLAVTRNRKKERKRKAKSWICETFEHVGKCRS